MEKIAKELGYPFDGIHAPANNKDHFSLAYTQFIMPLVKSVQEQQIIEGQNKKIDSQSEQIKKLNARIDELARIIESFKKDKQQSVSSDHTDADLIFKKK